MQTNNVTPKSNDSVKLNVNELLFQLVNNRYVIIAIVLLCTLAMFAYTKITYKAKYTSVAKIYVVDTEASTINSTELAISTYLARDYMELIVDRAVLEEVIDDLGLNMSYGSLKSKVAVENPDDTRIIEIHVTTGNPQESKRIAEKVCDVAQEKITELLAVDRVNIFSAAYLPGKANSANLGRNMFYGFAAGILLSMCFLFIVYSLNDKINSIDDIERHLEIPALGSIPYHSTKSGKKYYESNSKKKAGYSK